MSQFAAEKFTTRSREAIDVAQVAATTAGHSATEPIHLLAALLRQEDGTTRSLVTKAGVDVVESRISHLAYAPEMAQAMLRRQQASAVVAARQRIVEGAVGMVEMALEMLNKRDIVALDDERKAAMVSNLLVVLCGDRDAQPVINTGTLYG